MSELPPDPPQGPSLFVRLCTGLGLGIGASVASLFVVGAHGGMLAGAVPIVATLMFAIYLGISQRKYGYVTGVILAPFLVVTALYLLLMIIFGAGRHL